ncbi:PEP-CTERM sorting domain-containing protein [Rariglobus hedericola]|uniref:PEP-CTERM sorting domain-containing protein n=1 Tax=Rariglobus hedericola TaxID=2597822 RepID=A0A556QMH9_9BACT|nr:PEP-CTERM sorting domain-containing protein [Rariglobus hedericola]TSJ77802.1 PEP-CTERM sorting domain-containing protein [Rariglobus hedericola]
MKSSLLSRAAIAALILAGFATAARATTNGVNQAPLGTTTTPGVGYAFFEDFTRSAAPAPYNFFSTAETDADVITATFASTMAGGSAAGGGLRIYSGSGPTPNAFNITLSVTAVQDFSVFSLQIKHTAPSSGNWADFFTISTIDGQAGVQSLVSNSNEGSQLDFNIYQWTWTGLDIDASESFNITITSNADHVSVDNIRLDAGFAVSAVPEPSAYAAIFGGLVLAGAVLRRRRTAKVAV